MNKLPWTDAVRDRARSIHRLVNRKITYQTDGVTHPHLDIPEQWDLLLEGGHGDCEDYALTKRHHLRNEFPSYHHCFRIATCWTVARDDSSYHATLIIDTDAGMFILDNNFRDIVTIGSVNWRWHKIEDVTSPTGWSHLRN
jgi:predicted transglutaminase-like cysteine proteinase